MNKITKTPYNKTLSVLAILFCLILTFVLFIPNQIAYAEYNDLNENTLVNFNQYIQDEYINYSTNSYYSNILPIGTYYGKIDSNVNTSILFVFSGGGYYRQNIVIGNNNFKINILKQIQSIQFDNEITYTNFNMINLSQMFGENNIPASEQCKEYFTAQYYSYNTGTQIP